jgi:hypothetical protein
MKGSITTPDVQVLINELNTMYKNKACVLDVVGGFDKEHKTILIDMIQNHIDSEPVSKTMYIDPSCVVCMIDDDYKKALICDDKTKTPHIDILKRHLQNAEFIRCDKLIGNTIQFTFCLHQDNGAEKKLLIIDIKEGLVVLFDERTKKIILRYSSESNNDEVIRIEEKNSVDQHELGYIIRDNCDPVDMSILYEFNSILSTDPDLRTITTKRDTLGEIVDHIIYKKTIGDDNREISTQTLRLIMGMLNIAESSFDSEKIIKNVVVPGVGVYPVLYGHLSDIKYIEFSCFNDALRYYYKADIKGEARGEFVPHISCENSGLADIKNSSPLDDDPINEPISLENQKNSKIRNIITQIISDHRGYINFVTSHICMLERNEYNVLGIREKQSIIKQLSPNNSQLRIVDIVKDFVVFELTNITDIEDGTQDFKTSVPIRIPINYSDHTVDNFAINLESR